MLQRKWLFALLLVPLLLAIPLWLAASWKPHRVGVHPFVSKALPPFLPGAKPVPPQFNLMMAPDGARMLSISSESTRNGLAMWDVAGGRVLWKKGQRKGSEWRPLCFSPDGKTLAMVEEFDSLDPFERTGLPHLALFDAATGRQIAALPVKDASIYRFQDATFSRDGKQLVAATNLDVRTWDIAARRQISWIDLLTSDMRYGSFFIDATLAPSGARFIVDLGFAGSTPTIHRLGAQMRDGANRALWKMPAGVEPIFKFSPDGHLLFVSDQSSKFEMRDAATGRVIWKKTVAGAGFNARDWLPDGSAVVVKMDKEFEFWNARTGQITRTVSHGTMQRFVIAPDGDALYSVDFGGQIWRQRLR